MNSDSLFNEYKSQTINYAKLYKDSDGRIWEDVNSGDGGEPWTCGGCCSRCFLECIGITIFLAIFGKGVTSCQF